MTPALPYTQAESREAALAYGANCGPHALAAACGVPLLRAIEALPGFLKKGYTNPTMMEAGLRAVGKMKGVHYVVTRNLRAHAAPENGVARVQWEGSWLKSGVPPFVAYAHTHWIATRADHVACTAVGHFGFQPFSAWAQAVDALVARNPAYTGWHITHQYLFL